VPVPQRGKKIPSKAGLSLNNGNTQPLNGASFSFRQEQQPNNPGSSARALRVHQRRTDSAIVHFYLGSISDAGAFAKGPRMTERLSS
jgi:hypothetical protein